MSRRIGVGTAAALWLAAVGAGMAILVDYETGPGAAAAPPAHWPRAGGIGPIAGWARLVMLAHPRCPCTRASIGELAVLMARARDRLRADVLFHVPAGAAEGWERTDLWESAERIPGVRVHADRGGVRAGAFGAFTSGQVLVYDAAGRLAFAGGITASRGHAGDNAGRRAVETLVYSGGGAAGSTFVFGCPLSDRRSGAGRWRPPWKI